MFKLHSNNALKKGSTEVNNNSISVSLPPLSIKTILLKGNVNATGIIEINENIQPLFQIEKNNIHFTLKNDAEVIFSLYSPLGNKIANRKFPKGENLAEIQSTNIQKGIYLLKGQLGNKIQTQKILMR